MVYSKQDVPGYLVPLRLAQLTHVQTYKEKTTHKSNHMDTKFGKSDLTASSNFQMLHKNIEAAKA